MNASPALPLREPLLGWIREALAAHPRRMIEARERTRAAVLIMLFERDGEPWVVLTRRTETVRTHKGQISFPGGAQDPGDVDLWFTAVRETVEELGIDPASLQQLGVLDDHPTFGSEYLVAPFVAAVEPPARWHPSEHEIAEVIELPLGRLLAEARSEVWERDGVRYPMHVFDVDGHRVWGLTAFILRRFLDIVAPSLARRESSDAS